jgi:hypothetical protein
MIGKMSAQWKRLLNLVEADDRFVTSSYSIRLRITNSLDYSLIRIIPGGETYEIIDRFKSNPLAESCDYAAAEDYLYRLLLMPKLEAISIDLPECRNIEKKGKYVYIRDDGNASSYYISSEYMLAGDGSETYRIIARGDRFKRRNCAYTDDLLARLIRQAARG